MHTTTSRVALVTGGASGLGNVIARRLARDAISVVITDRQADLGREAASEGGFTFLEHDVRDEAQWVHVMQEIEGGFGRLDVLVNNAGVLGPTDAVSPEDSRLIDWRAIFAVNVEGVFLGCRAAIPAMRRAGGGSIINIASVAGLLATPYATAYGASKAAVRQLTKSVAQHCAQQRLNIRCNSVHPGDVLTSLWLKRAQDISTARGVPVEEIIAEAKAVYPMGDFVHSEDIAAAVSFLASKDSRHMTGGELIVDGGLVNCDTYRMTSKNARSEAALPR
jgi:3(or 17)beta-hydroxysteroid dehydrogenase